MVTKLFKSGNSLAVRIPASLCPGREGTAVEIIRQRGGLRIRPAVRSLKGILQKFAAFDPGFMKEGREKGMGPKRSW
ncbi:MAG: hypothetical protein A2487_01170 [Candidatus Raymondbacteria bacterium RifOxyC12_full_50_8]|uniref:SpoVT-AbrB domain-containing protein n=1 Tax=Candidatus Raymondbacteria bacterium RIFOXYD12_FULL_49_13 TaxID=1817890 RepID=A0A1F7F9M2_UNCRA|nr:MAG: hypothetical protein A2248_09760 [Candidatus Raymondbacteria bacterium RIFOXYA2_FULL_49_16]OGJ91854.1 MAG: hypothetical protein A2350_21480 [Candidatus Raymondbacteria bacterium RifOxyB12_full_50_8]OGJ95504.1 MAG: hypothetical protein A2487_01170 [Candidatus Raymondbacteria bacterium RifOxyC12_full_50_8]OGJ97189.1 MAG: hypothetical protein A2453_10405 [Candidatus Raymondbacteria bacterium RIFOXYC2_FULL_50_21]OGK03222.1 MAG: hypothetical protein A2519_05155 [Candidatus Raymondbacteria ba